MELQNVVPWGRSLREYEGFFSLTKTDLKKTILGCGDGPASFNAELTAQGGSVISVDPTYCFNGQQLQTRISEVYDEIMPQVHHNKESFIWDSISSVEDLGKIRMSAMNKFLADYEMGKEEGRYVEASLPSLNFKHKAFDLALCSHYLFLYSKQVNYDEHVESLKELCRVSKEVRVYPLIALDGKVSPHLDQVLIALNKSGYSTTLTNVTYQFQKGANQMLVIKSV